MVNDRKEKIWGIGIITLVVLMVMGAFASVGVHPLVTLILVGLLGVGGWICKKAGI